MSTVSTSSCSNHASESPTAVDSFRLRFRPTGSIRQTLFGKVLAAEDTRTRGSVVVKSSSKVAVQLSQSAESPSNELRVLQRIERSGGHPKIVRLLGWHEDEKNILLALEKCTGGDLLSAIQRRGGEGLSEDVARAVARQLIGAIGYLHKLGLAHLDISPENVLISDVSALDVKLCDFGGSREAKQGCKLKGTPGKLNYAAPEIVSRKPFDPFKADSYSFGAMLFVMLTGHPAYDLENAKGKTCARYASGGPRKLAQLVAAYGYDNELSDVAIDLIGKLMDRSPESRISIKEAARHPWFEKA